MAGTVPRRDKMGIVSEQSAIVGIGDWIEQLVAESTGKDGSGVLPVVLDGHSPDLSAPDLLAVHIRDDGVSVGGDSVTVSAPLGAQMMLWEVATAVAGKLLGVNPFDQPDVESAKVAARSFLDGTPAPVEPFATENGVRLYAVGYEPRTTGVTAAIREVIGLTPADGYVSIHAYADRGGFTGFEDARDVVAAASGGRPTTFGWGPRFLHSTGQYHKGGPAHGVFIQIIDNSASDRVVPGRPYSFGTLIAAQAQGDARVLAEHGRPVLTVSVSGEAAVRLLVDEIRSLE